MPFIDLRKFSLSGFPYHIHNSLSVPVFTSYTLFIHQISPTISTIIFIPIHPFIPLQSTHSCIPKRHMCSSIQTPLFHPASQDLVIVVHIFQRCLSAFSLPHSELFFSSNIHFPVQIRSSLPTHTSSLLHCPRTTFCMDDRVQVKGFVVVFVSRFLFQCPMHQEFLYIAKAVQCIGEGFMLPFTQLLKYQ